MSQFCTSCGQPVVDAGAFCGSCGAKRGPLQPNALNVREQEFFSDPELGIRVTNARFIIGPGKVYAMAGITSVALGRTPDRRGWPALFLALTLLWGFAGARQTPEIIVVLILSLLCAIWIRGASPRWVIRLFTAGGQQEVVESKRRVFVERVIAGLNEAIIARGQVVA